MFRGKETENIHQQTQYKLPNRGNQNVFLTGQNDACENRDVATVDIPSAFMHAKMNKVIHIKMKGKMAELLTCLEPNLYHDFMRNENG
jgi:hypothetical protein